MNSSCSVRTSEMTYLSSELTTIRIVVCILGIAVKRRALRLMSAADYIYLSCPSDRDMDHYGMDLWHRSL
jgi:hypothetical protein